VAQGRGATVLDRVERRLPYARADEALVRFEAEPTVEPPELALRVREQVLVAEQEAPLGRMLVVGALDDLYA
jgi:hypothetical protein